eukprot:m.131117 g.131117  ORF g.131117 m.131117 type:complete len:328 (+) comp16450_c0_seq1:1540-2523(+)
MVEDDGQERDGDEQREEHAEVLVELALDAGKLVTSRLLVQHHLGLPARVHGQADDVRRVLKARALEQQRLDINGHSGIRFGSGRGRVGDGQAAMENLLPGAVWFVLDLPAKRIGHLIDRRGERRVAAAAAVEAGGVGGNWHGGVAADDGQKPRERVEVRGRRAALDKGFEARQRGHAHVGCGSRTVAHLQAGLAIEVRGGNVGFFGLEAGEQQNHVAWKGLAFADLDKVADFHILVVDLHDVATVAHQASGRQVDLIVSLVPLHVLICLLDRRDRDDKDERQDAGDGVDGGEAGNPAQDHHDHEVKVSHPLELLKEVFRQKVPQRVL